MDDRGGKIEILLPYATIEPIREQLLQMFMGEKFGRDPIWEGHLATEIYAADVEVEAVLHEVDLPLSRVLDMKPGETVMFDRSPSDPITLRCGDVELTEGDHGPYRQPRLGARGAPAQSAQGDDGGIRSHRRQTGGTLMLGLPLGYRGRGRGRGAARRSRSATAWCSTSG